MDLVVLGFPLEPRVELVVSGFNGYIIPEPEYLGSPVRGVLVGQEELLEPLKAKFS